MRNIRVFLFLLLSIIVTPWVSAWGNSRSDPALLPVPSGSLSPFIPLSEYAAIYMPSKWREVSKDLWEFDLPPQTDLRSGSLRARDSYRSFDAFMLSIIGTVSQIRIIGPVGFPDKFDDRRERYYVHFLEEGKMMAAIYGSVIDWRHDRKINIEFVFDSYMLDYFDSLTYAILCNIKSPDNCEVKEVGTYAKCVTVHECSALLVPSGQATVEEAVSFYYASLITNRWDMARSYLYPGIDIWPPCYNVLFKERAWWAVKWFRLLYKRVYGDRVECCVMKGVRQKCDEQEGVDTVELKQHNNKWYISRLP